MTEKKQNNDYFYMNSAEVLDASFGIYKKSFWEQILLNVCFSSGVATILFIPIYLFLIYVYTVFFISFFNNQQNSNSMGMVIVVTIIVLTTFFSISKSVIASGNFFISKQIFCGEKKSLGKAFSSAFKSIPKGLLVGIAQSIINMVPIVFLLPVILNIDNIFKEGWFVLFVVCVCLFILSYLVIDTLMVYSTYAAINEKKLFFSAIIKGFSLIKGSFWRTLGIRLIMNTLITLLSYSITAGVQFVISIASEGFSNPGLFVIFMVFQYLLSFVISTLTQPLSSILDSTLYFNQKVKKDGLDMSIRLTRLEEKLKGGSL